MGEGEQLSARQALELATVGGAAVLGRDDIGALAPGYAADFVAIDLNRVELAGALHDPVAGAVLCSLGGIDHSWVGGRPLVQSRQVIGVDSGPLVERHNLLAADLVG